MASNGRHPTVHAVGRGLRLSWPDGHEGWFHHRWLRENCGCPKCMHPDAWERVVDVLALPLDLEPSAVIADGNGLHLMWPDHGAPCDGTDYSWEWLDRHRTETTARLERVVRPTAWRSADIDLAAHTIDYDSVVGGDGGMELLLSNLLDHGFALVDGLPLEDGAVERFALRIAPLEESHFGRRFEVRSKPDPENLAYTNRTLPPHNDLPSREHLPGVQLLHCLANDADGGDSVLVDGIAAAETLRTECPEAFALLAGTPVRYSSVADTWAIVNRRPVIDVDPDGFVNGTRLHPALLGPVDIPPDVIDEWYSAHDALLAITMRPEMRLVFRLYPGQCQVFDNRRMLHSRTGFDLTTGDRILQGCYLPFDDVVSRFATLRRRGHDFRVR